MVNRIWASNPFSKGASQLSKALDFPRLRHDNPQWKPTAADGLINWGATTLPNGLGRATVINDPDSVTLVSNKLLFFKAVGDKARTVPWFVSNAETEATVKKHIAEGRVVVARTLLRSSGGNGIRIIEKDLDFCPAPLYTVYVPKRLEYRVHIVGSEVIDVQRKIKRPDKPTDEVDWHIRNHVGGFIFVRNGVRDAVPADVLTQAMKAMEAVDLDFGAVDVIYNDKQERAYVLEINSAPGLEGATVTKYAEAIRKHFHELLHLPTNPA